jgi:hypothetical protein
MPSANSRYMGANIEGKARRFLPYLGPEGVGGYRRRCAEIAESQAIPYPNTGSITNVTRGAAASFQ